MLLVISTTFAASLGGHYVAVTPPEAIAAAQKAEMELSFASLPSLLRPVGERLLAPSLFHCREYVMSISPVYLDLRCDDKPGIQYNMDGSIREIVYEGKTLQSRVWTEGEALLLSIASDTGTRTSRFTPTDGGMDLKVQVASERLDRPVSWEIRYQRSP